MASRPSRHAVTKKRKIGIVMANGWSLKTFIYSGVIDHLAKDFEICAWARQPAIEALEREGKSGEVPPMKLFPVRPTTESKAERAVRQLQKSLFAARYRLETEEVKKQTAYSAGQRFAANLVGLPSRTPLGSAMLNALQPMRRRTARRNWYAQDFDTFKPDAVVLGHPVDLNEWVISIQAHDRKIPVIASVLSWDNLTSKGVIADFFAGTLVWNETMRQEMFTLYPNYHPDQTHIVGVPRFQPCLAPLPADYEREPFLKRLGLDPKKKIIFFATTPSFAYPEQPEVARHVVEAIKSGELADCQVLVRRHPRDDSQIPESEHLKFWIQSVKNVDVHNWTPDRADGWILAAMLRHSAVNLNPASTITLEAAICDLPVINLAYDGDVEKPYAKSIRRYYDFSHQKPLLKFGATAMARSRPELIAQIREAIDHPEIRRKERYDLANYFCSLKVGDPAVATANAIRRIIEPSE